MFVQGFGLLLIIASIFVSIRQNLVGSQLPEEEPLLTRPRVRIPKWTTFLLVLGLLLNASLLVIDTLSLFKPTGSKMVSSMIVVSDTLLILSWVLGCCLVLVLKEQVYASSVYKLWLGFLWWQLVVVLYLIYQMIQAYPNLTDLLPVDQARLAVIISMFIPNTIISWKSTKKTIILVSSMEEQSVQPTSWKHLHKRIKQLFPFMWPSAWKLQSLVLMSLVMLLLGRVINVLVPYQYKVVVNALTGDTQDKRPYFAWGAILVFVTFRFFQGGVGLLSSLQNLMWIPVSQSTTRKISVKMLEHLHQLSLQFHLNRKTGEVLRVMDRGTASVGSLLSYILFNIIPVFVDIGIAVVYFISMFGWDFGLIVFITMGLYILFTVWITEWRTKYRKEMIELDNASTAKAVDSLLNFETVKYYNAESWEVRQYEKAICAYQKADWKSQASLNILNTAQNITITIGLLVGCLLCAYRVAVEETLNVGDFVFFMTYITQLYQPLNWFGTYYRVIQQNFIDMEKMFDLLNQDQAIKDVEGAPQLRLKEGGKIVFDDVTFSYDQRVTSIKNVSFEVPVGKTVALVGPTGGGKSTVFRLLFRFYDVTSGSIKIDDQDIRKVSQISLRSHIGVVPQDTVLFNETIKYNIRYGKLDATDEEVEQAAKAAQIHDRIVEFPDGYETMVGERGMRLSGGEKQRVAIARTLLKNPSIILLDEATSALDNTTEKCIQSSLQKLGKDKTTLVIAHRLSTIVDADIILVMKNGQIVERGTHKSLLQNGKKASAKELAAGVGTYYQLWMEQQEKEEHSRKASQ